MMNFYYDPILGLRYDFLGALFLIDLECLPETEFDIETWKYYISKTGIQLCDSNKNTSSIEVITNITNYML